MNAIHLQCGLGRGEDGELERQSQVKQHETSKLMLIAKWESKKFTNTGKRSLFAVEGGRVGVKGVEEERGE